MGYSFMSKGRWKDWRWSGCTKCHTTDESKFAKNRRNRNGLQKACRDCRKKFYGSGSSPLRKRRENLKTMYKMSLEGYDNWLALQGGMCGVCGLPPTGKPLVVDHDHACCSDKHRTCGECVRGLVHTKCNNLLGQANDDPILLAKAIEYLQKNRLSMPN